MLEEVAKDAWEYGRKIFFCREKSQIISLSLGKQIQYILDYVLKQKMAVISNLAIPNAVLLYRVSVKLFPSQQHCNTSVKKRSLRM